jgi:tight adherence protein B
MPEGCSLLEAVLPLSLFLAAALFTYVGIELFSRGWESYEQRYVEGAERTLAAMYLSMRPQHLLYLSVLGFFVFGALGIGLFGSWGVGIAAGALGFSLPRLIILWMKKRRDALFRQQIPGMVDTVSRGLKSGLSLPQCFQVIERELPNPTSQEFRVLNQQMRLGMPTDQALRSLLERMPNNDLDLIVAAVNVSTELGGNLTEILGNIAETVRERFMLEGKIRTLTSQGRLQAVVLAAMPVLVFFALHAVNPNLMRPMYTTPLGWAMILGVLIWEALGVFFLWKIVAIKA